MPLVFINVFDHGALEIGRNHIQSLKRAGITNHLAYVSDKESYDILRADGVNVELIDPSLNMNIDTRSKSYGTGTFNQYSYLRYALIQKHLERGEDVWYLDVDTVVLKDLNTEYEVLRTKPSVDAFFQDDIGSERICTGCMLFISNKYTIEFVEHIRKAADDHVCDQTYVNELLSTHPNVLFYELLNPLHYTAGRIYFDEKDGVLSTVDPASICFVHANWMLGVQTKIHALKRKGLWLLTDHL